MNRSTEEDKIESNKVIGTILQLAGDLGGRGVDVVDLRMNSIKIGDYLVDDPNPNITHAYTWGRLNFPFDNTKVAG